jgi:hypothetical protein
MNERIRQLAEQAGYTKDMFGIGHWDMPECQKFAELIIRECAEMVRKHNEQFMENESHYGVVSADVLKHFGVEL